nr:universal stress protein [Amycolatopsis sp. DSM 110486]
MQEKYPDIEVTRVVAKGRPSEGLLVYPDRAQLLVVGRRGRAPGLALGSTSQSLISYALCPVIAARGTPSADSDVRSRVGIRPGESRVRAFSGGEQTSAGPGSRTRARRGGPPAEV